MSCHVFIPGSKHRRSIWQQTALALMLLTIVFAVTCRSDAAEPLVRVQFTVAGEVARTVEGRVLVEAQDGGCLLQGRDGVLWTVTPAQLESREATGDDFAPLSAEELGRQLVAEMGEGFEVVRTEHYVICTNAGAWYGQWCGDLFERLMTGFGVYWKRMELTDPEFPLAAIVFRNPQEFARYATQDAGPSTASSKGYYSIRTNRIVLFDLTTGTGGRPAQSLAEISQRVTAVSANVATVVHEATHQIAFNSGLHHRYADNPVWLTEGMAMYFETPDLRTRGGWKTIGRVSPTRLRQFEEYARKRRPDAALESLIADNARFTDAETAGDAYAEAWALTHFLIKTRREDYENYLTKIAGKRPLSWDEPGQRLADFRAAFGDDLQALDVQFLRHVKRY